MGGTNQECDTTKQKYQIEQQKNHLEQLDFSRMAFGITGRVFA